MKEKKPPEQPQYEATPGQEITPAEAHNLFKKTLIEAFNNNFPEERLDLSRDVGMYDEDGKIKLVQELGTIEMPKEKTFELGLKTKEYIFDPDDAKRYFQTLRPEAQKAFLDGLKESIEAADKIIEEYKKVMEDEETTTEEKEEAQKNLEEEQRYLEARNRLIKNLT